MKLGSSSAYFTFAQFPWPMAMKPIRGKDEVAVLGIDFGICVAGIEDKAFVGNSVHGQKGVAGVNQCGSGLSKEGGHGLYPNPL